MSTVAVNDPWLEDAHVDFSLDREPLLAQLEQIQREGENPQIIQYDETPEPEPIAAAPEPTPVAEPTREPEPSILELEDGSSVRFEKSNRGWKATLTGGTGATPEVFYGKTKDEMFQNVAVGKLKATTKIRELNRKIKIGDTPTAERPAPVPASAARSLTADEVFEIKTQLESNPGLAMDNWFQKRTGMSPDALIALAEKGRRANEALELESTSKDFIASHPQYATTTDNFKSMIAYLAKHKLRQSLNDGNRDEILSELLRTGNYTVENLDEAFEELTESGLLQTKRTAPEPQAEEPQAPAAVVPAPQAPAPPPDGRIVRTERRPRAGLGIRTGEISTPESVSPQKPPSVEELDDLSDAAIAELMANTRRAAQTRR